MRHCAKILLPFIKERMALLAFSFGNLHRNKCLNNNYQVSNPVMMCDITTISYHDVIVNHNNRTKCII